MTTSISDAPQVELSAADRDIWVARVRGEFVGVVAVDWHGNHIATARQGRRLGLFDSLDAARTAFLAEFR